MNSNNIGGPRGLDHMVVGFTTTYFDRLFISALNWSF